MPPVNTKLRAFHVTFRTTDPFEHLVAQSMSKLPYGNGKTIFLRMMRYFFEKCRTPEEMVAAINEAVDNVLSLKLNDAAREQLNGLEYLPARRGPKTAEALAAAARRPAWQPQDALAG